MKDSRFVIRGSRLAASAAAFAFALLAGCATVNRSKSFHGVHVEDGQTPIESVEIENSSWLLFKCLPIASGEVNHPNQNGCRWFEDTATLQSNLEMLGREMKAVHATRIANLTSHNVEENFLFVLISHKGYHTSAVLLGENDLGLPQSPDPKSKGQSPKSAK